MLEVCPVPAAAVLDGQQSLSVEDFARLVSELAPVAEAVGRKL
jgi:3-deoxy-7-phosphoheptulonate synthase